ncbi:MAG: MoaF C-terminal domain-containing protein [Pseudomonadota bacterium]
MTDKKHAEFMQVGDFVTNFGGNELEHTEDLAGKSFTIHFNNSQVIRFTFEPGQKLEWLILQGAASDQPDPVTYSESYRASCLRHGYYLVDFVKRRNPTESVTLVIDLVKNIATSVIAIMPTREETLTPLFQRVIDREILSPMCHEISFGSIDHIFSENTARHQPTEELIGKRVLYQYGPKDSYEHIYLNREFYTWHCIQGPESGLADTDFCRYYKLTEALYLFVWIEKVIPTIGVILIDFTRSKTTGKIFGYQGDDFGATCNTPVGAYLTLKNETRY